MKKLLIPFLLLTCFIGYGQGFMNPATSISTAKYNASESEAPAVSGTDTYTLNYYNVAAPYGIVSYTGFAKTVTFTNPNTGASTLTLNGLVPKEIRKYSGGSLVPVEANDIAGRMDIYYDGTYIVIKGAAGGNSGPIDAADVTFTPVGNISATDVQAMGAELDTEKQPTDSDLTTIAGLSPSNDDFLQRKSGAWANRTVAQVKTDLGLTGTNSGDQTATTVPNTPAGNIAATTVQSAINELDSEKQSSITFGTGVQTALGVNVGSNAGSLVVKDANQNITVNNTLKGYATTATAAGTTTLTVSSAPDQYFTGTTTQTVTLPVTSTLVLGQEYRITNNSTGIVTVQSSGANTIQAMASNSILTVKCILTSGTGTASWSSLYYTSNPMTTWGDIMYGGDPGALGVAPPTKLGPGTSGYFLQTNGSGAAPSWVAPGGLSGLTATRIPVAISASTIADYNGLKYDDSGRTLTVGYSSSGSNIISFATSGTAITSNTSTGEFRVGTAPSHFPTFYANNGEAMRIVSATKDVLIGTTTDNSKLTVNGSVAFGYVAKTANYTATINDYTIECTANTFQVTLPTAVGITGREYVIINSGAGTITIGTTSSQTFINVIATPTTLTMSTVGTRVVISNGANWMLKNSL